MKEIFLKFSDYILSNREDLRKIRGGYDPSTCRKTCPSGNDAVVECDGGCGTDADCAYCDGKLEFSCCTPA